MKLEKLLAENMLRFGTKNLLAKHVKPYLMEQGIKVYSLSQLPAALESSNYVPSPTNYIVISDGNPWLAANRAISLKNFLAKNVEQQVKIPFDTESVTVEETAVSPNKGDQYQYVEGTLYAILEKPGIPIETYKYQLLYNFYEINGVPYIVVTAPGKGSPILNSPDTNQQTDVNSLLKNGATAIGQGGLIVKEQLPGEANYGIVVPLPNNIKFKRSGTRLYFSDLNSLDTMSKFIEQYTDGAPILSKNRDTADLVSNNFTSTQGGGGNYIFGRKGGTKITILNGPKPNTATTLTRTYGESGDGAGKSVAGTGTSPERIKIGTFQLTKEEGAFLDNMITIQPGAYQKIFDELKTAIAQYTPKFKIVSITASVKGYASADRSTNRLPKGITKPDHTYGGAVPVQYWVIQ
jgi:hypothetical protein